MLKLSKLKTGMPLQNSKSLFVFVPTAYVENVDIEITVHQVLPTNMVFVARVIIWTLTCSPNRMVIRCYGRLKLDFKGGVIYHYTNFFWNSINPLIKIKSFIDVLFPNMSHMKRGMFRWPLTMMLELNISENGSY